MFNYVINNIIKLNKNTGNGTISNLKINFANFKRVGDVYDVLSFMKNRGLIINYDIEQFGRARILAEIKTIYSPEELVDKIGKYKEDKNFNILFESEEIQLHFNSK
jgi:hypothetical protein